MRKPMLQVDRELAKTIESFGAHGRNNYRKIAFPSLPVYLWLTTGAPSALARLASLRPTPPISSPCTSLVTHQFRPHIIISSSIPPRVAGSPPCNGLRLLSTKSSVANNTWLRAELRPDRHEADTTLYTTIIDKWRLKDLQYVAAAHLAFIVCCLIQTVPPKPCAHLSAAPVIMSNQIASPVVDATGKTRLRATLERARGGGDASIGQWLEFPGYTLARTVAPLGADVCEQLQKQIILEQEGANSCSGFSSIRSMATSVTTTCTYRWEPFHAPVFHPL